LALLAASPIFGSHSVDNSYQSNCEWNPDDKVHAFVRNNVNNMGNVLHDDANCFVGCEQVSMASGGKIVLRIRLPDFPQRKREIFVPKFIHAMVRPTTFPQRVYITI